MKKIKIFILMGLSLLFLSSCSFPGLASNDDEDTIAVTGGITSEMQILGSITAGMVEHYTDKKTTVINNLATNMINHQAMLKDDASISSARYTGTDLSSILQLPAERILKKPLLSSMMNLRSVLIKPGSLLMVLTIRMYS